MLMAHSTATGKERASGTQRKASLQSKGECRQGKRHGGWKGEGERGGGLLRASDLSLDVDFSEGSRLGTLEYLAGLASKEHSLLLAVVK